MGSDDPFIPRILLIRDDGINLRWHAKPLETASIASKGRWDEPRVLLARSRSWPTPDCQLSAAKRAVTEPSEGHPGAAGVDGPAQRSYPRAHARSRPRSGRHSPLLERRVLRRRDALAAQYPWKGAAVGARLVGQDELDAPLVAVVKDVGDPLAVSQVELAQR